MLLLGIEAFPGLEVLPVECTLVLGLWVLHFILVVNNFEDTAPNLCS